MNIGGHPIASYYSPYSPSLVVYSAPTNFGSKLKVSPGTPPRPAHSSFPTVFIARKNIVVVQVLWRHVWRGLQAV